MLGMELAGLAFGVATFVTAIVLVVFLRVNWLRSRSVLVAVIPLSCLAGKIIPPPSRLEAMAGIDLIKRWLSFDSTIV